MILIQTIKIMASFSAFVRFCAKQTGCDKGGLYAIQPRGLRGSPIKIGYSFNLLRRMADWEYNFPEGIDILAVARMNRPNDTHFHKRRVLQLAEAWLKQELRQYVVAREGWVQPCAKAATLAAMRRLQLSPSPSPPATSSTPHRSRHLGSTRLCLWGLAREFGARSRKLHLGPRRGVKQRSFRHQRSGPATCGAREWSQSARRMLYATGSTRRVDVAGAWRANLRAPRQVEPTYAHLAQHVRSAAEGTSTQATDEHGPECRWIVQPRHRNSRTYWPHAASTRTRHVLAQRLKIQARAPRTLW